VNGLREECRMRGDREKKEEMVEREIERRGRM
jgi:hypothetical protein